MTTTNIGRLTRVDLRELWRHEARDFTTWLGENLDLLGEALGMKLSLQGTEYAAGPFAADILADDGRGNLVVIENQLEPTDHDHLGKLITYLSNLDAKTAIWVSKEPRLEHEKAVHWLNEVFPADTAFYLVRIEAYRIGDSEPAPLFAIVAGPSAQARKTGDQKKELAERHVLRLEFWEQLLTFARQRTRLHDRRSPTTDNWISVSAGHRGLEYSYVIRMDDAQIVLYIDAGSADANKRIFDTLLRDRETIETRFGAPLDWQRLEDRRACRICHQITRGGLQNRAAWPEVQAEMVDAMVRLEAAFGPEIRKLS